MRGRGIWRLALLPLVLTVALVPSGCRAADLDRRVTEIAAPYRFSIAAWEVGRLPSVFASWIATDALIDTDTSALVRHYFELGEAVRAAEYRLARVKSGAAVGDAVALTASLDAIIAERQALAPAAADALAAQITEVLVELNFADAGDGPWPPVSFVLETPPRLLIVSPADRIQTLRTVNLKQSVTEADRTAIEAAVDALGVVSIVDNLGGIGATYPAFVSARGGLEWVVETAVEEWLHQYLFFKPLGFRYAAYLLDLGGDPGIATVNETFAEIVSDEVAAVVMRRYYPTEVAADHQPDPAAFDFDAAMRGIRRHVDDLLAEGSIDAAAAYMDERRDYLEANGYYIRKLNQAYFAFHGRYAAAPHSVDPLGDQLRAYRAGFSELSDFVAAVAVVRSRDELARLMAAG
jgi:hypothetical protein